MDESNGATGVTQVYKHYNAAGQVDMMASLYDFIGNGSGNIYMGGIDTYSYNGDGQTALVQQFDSPYANGIPSSAANEFNYAISSGGPIYAMYKGPGLNPNGNEQFPNMDAVDTEQVSYQYNPDGTVASISRAWGAAGQSASHSGPTTTYSYDKAGRLLSETTSEGTASIAAYASMSYDPDNRLLSDTYTPSGTLNGGGNYTYSYSPDGQLTGATYPANTTAPPLTLTYDANGNRNLPSGSSSAPVDNEVASDGTYTYTYDANGNVLSQTGTGITINYTWDYRNRLIKVAEIIGSGSSATTTTAAYTYDFENRLISETDTTTVGTASPTTVTYEYAYDGSSLVLALNVTARGYYYYMTGTEYLPDPTGGSAPLAQQSVSASAPPDWLLTDENGSVQDVEQDSANGAVTIADHVVFDAYGNKIVGDTGFGSIEGVSGSTFPTITTGACAH